MNSFQTVINYSARISMSKKRVSSQSISRSGMIKTASLANKVPWVFTVEMPPGLRYTDTGIREFLSELDDDGLRAAHPIELGSSNAGLTWLTAYQGDLTSAQIAQLRNHSDNATVQGSILTVDVQNVTGSSPNDILVKAGDFIQPLGGYLYPYVATQTVLIGDVTQVQNYQVQIPVNRPVIQQAGYTHNTSNGIAVGSDVTWTVKLLSAPEYSVNPDRLVEWDTALMFMEFIND